MEMDSLKELIQDMQNREIIINKDKGSTESFHINDNSLDDSLTCDDHRYILIPRLLTSYHRPIYKVSPIYLLQM